MNPSPNRHYYGKILHLGAPILVGQLGMIVVGFADNAMIGHYSTASLSAASFVNNIFNIAILTCLGFSYGLTPLIGALYGKLRHDDIGATLRRGLVINVLFAIAMTAVMWGVYLNLEYLGQPEELLPLIKPYYLTYLGGILPIALFNTFAQYSYAINSTKMPMWIILGGNVINVVGNYLLIYGIGACPELGLTGAGLSTLAARWFGPAVIFFVFMTGKRYKACHQGFFGKLQAGESFGKIWRTSFPISLQLGSETASFSLAAVMAGWLGALQLASFQIIVTVGTLGFCVYYGMGAATSVLVANATTSGGVQQMRHIAFDGYRIMLVMAALSSTLFIVAGHLLVRIFTSDPAVEAMTLSLLFPLVLYQLGDATQITFANALRGTANVVPMVWIAVFSYVVVGLPVTYLMAFTLGMDIYGIVLSWTVSLMLAGMLFLWFFLRTTRPSKQHACE